MMSSHPTLDPKARVAQQAENEKQMTQERAVNVHAEVAEVAEGAKKTADFFQGTAYSSHPVANAVPGLVDKAREHTETVAKKMENGYAQTSDDRSTPGRTLSRSVQAADHPGASPLPDQMRQNGNIAQQPYHHEVSAKQPTPSGDSSTAPRTAAKQPTPSNSSTPVPQQAVHLASAGVSEAPELIANATHLESKAKPAVPQSDSKDVTSGHPASKATAAQPKKPDQQDTKQQEASKSIDKERLEKSCKAKKILEKVQPKPEFVGWKEVGGWDERDRLESDEEVEDMLARSTLLESYISEKFYGDWYQNTALIVGTAFFSWLVARLGGGIHWVGLVLAFAATAYRTSIRRVRRNFRDDVTREMQKKKLETDTETMEWLNTFLQKFWLIYEPVLSETVITIGNQVLADATPGFIESLSLDTFTLGTKPPRIDHVRTFPETAEDIAVMDWAFSFTPNDTLDMTARQVKTKVNPKVVLGVRVGKGVISKSLPIIVEDMSFSGLMRVRVKMMTSFPHIQTVDVAFLNPPEIDFVLKPIGGETLGFDINIIPGLSRFIKEMIDANAGPMLYAPNAFQLNVEQMLAGAGVDVSIGVLAVNLRSAKELKGSEAIGNTVDPYVKFSFGDKELLAKSHIKSNTKNPIWNETHYLLVKNLNEVLTLQVVDFNEYRKDKLIGTAHFPMESLENQPDQEGVSGDILSNGKSRGKLIFDTHFYPILEGKKLDDGTVEPPPDSKSGIFKMTIHQAKGLDAKRSLVGQLSCYADIAIGGRQVARTKVVKRNNSPIWEYNQEHLIRDKTRTKLSITIRDCRGMSTHPVIATYTTNLSSLLAAIEAGKDWFNLTSAGQIQIAGLWKPLALKDRSGTSGYIEPIGVARIHIKKASGLRNLERVGTINPCIRIMVGGFQKARTQVLENTLDPEFDETVYAPIHSDSQPLLIEAMDVEKMGNDRSLGNFKVDIANIIQSDGKGGYSEYASNEIRTGQLVQGQRGAKGTVQYNIQFYPAMHILSPAEVEEKKKAAEEKARAAAEKAEDGKDEKQKKDVSDGAALDAELSGGAEPQGIEMPLEKQLEYQHGVFALDIHYVASCPDNCYMRVRFDMSTYPSFVSPKLRGPKMKVLETAEHMVRELDFSQTTFEIVRKKNSLNAQDLVQHVTVPTIDLLRNGFQTPRQIKFGTNSGYVEVQARYFPVELTLDPVESINNQGMLRLDILDAADLEAADRNGKSDPYAVVRYNGEKLHTTKVQKKTLNPAWNEFWEGPIPKRINGRLEIQVFDWDMGPGQDDPLGTAKIDLTKLEPMEQAVLVAPLEGHQGTIRLKALFKPGYVQVLTKAKTLLPGTVMSGAAGVPGKVLNTAGIPVKMVGEIGGSVVGGAVGGVGSKGAGLLKSAFGRGHKNNSQPSSLSQTHVRAATQAQDGQNDEDYDKDNKDNGSASGDQASMAPSARRTRGNSISSSVSTLHGAGIVRGVINFGSINGFEGHHALQVRAYVYGNKEKEIFKSKPIKSSGGEVRLEESVPFKASPDAKLVFKVMAHKSLGRDSELGAASLALSEISEHATPLAFNDGDGHLTVQIDYKSA